MNYFVYRQLKNKSFVLLGQTRYLHDAKHIYNHWNQAYIVTSSGAMVKSKNIVH